MFYICISVDKQGTVMGKAAAWIHRPGNSSTGLRTYLSTCLWPCLGIFHPSQALADLPVTLEGRKWEWCLNWHLKGYQVSSETCSSPRAEGGSPQISAHILNHPSHTVSFEGSFGFIVSRHQFWKIYVKDLRIQGIPLYNFSLESCCLLVSFLELFVGYQILPDMKRMLHFYFLSTDKQISIFR